MTEMPQAFADLTAELTMHAEHAALSYVQRNPKLFSHMRAEFEQLSADRAPVVVDAMLKFSLVTAVSRLIAVSAADPAVDRAGLFALAKNVGEATVARLWGSKVAQN